MNNIPNSIRRVFLPTFLAISILSIFALSTNAATYTVDTTTNSSLTACTAAVNDCSLRGAIANANGTIANDTIEFDTGVFATTQTITLASTLQFTTAATAGNLTVNGTGASKLLISGNNAVRVLLVDTSANVTLNNLSIINGLANGATSPNPEFGAGIYNTGTLNINNSTISNNNSTSSGGGIFNTSATGILTVTNSTIANNSNTTTAGFGGGLQNSFGAVTLINSAVTGNTNLNGAGGINSSGNPSSLTVSNSTISGNSTAANNGGGIRLSASTQVTITNSTIANNSAGTGTGGGISISSGSPTLRLRNTIISGNSAATQPDIWNNSNVNTNSLGNNIIGNTSTNTAITWAGSDLQNTNPRLAPLGNYGGTTQTHSLLSGSPALNAGQNCVNTSSCVTFNPPANITTDQRGAIRPTSTTTDIGAFELPASPTDFTAALPGGTQSVAYSTSLVANTTFGSTTYTYTLFGGDTLPNGLTLMTSLAPQAALQISGTPTVNGTFAFRVQASDGVNTQITQYSLNIAAPTAAAVSIGGRVFNPSDLALRSAQVVLTDSSGNRRTARTNAFGYFLFSEVTVGENYIVEVFSKQFNFNSQVVFVTEEISELNFTAEPVK